MIGGDGPIVHSEPMLLPADEYPLTLVMHKDGDTSAIVWAVTVLAPVDMRLHVLKIPPGRVWIGSRVDVAVINPAEWRVGCRFL